MFNPTDEKEIEAQPSFQKTFSAASLYALFFRVASILVFAGLLMIGCQKISLPIPETGLKTISIVMDNNYPPFAFLDSNSNMQGILVDQWELWEKRLALQLKFSEWIGQTH